MRRGGVISACSDWYNGKSMRYLAYLQQDEDGVFVAACPSLPGCVSQGATRSEAQANIREAIELYLQSLQKHGEPIPASSGTDQTVPKGA